MKYCRNCGGPLKDGATFCPECGNPVKKAAGTEQKSKPVVSEQSQSSNPKPNVTQASRTNKPRKPLFKSKKSKIITAIILTFGIIMFGSYYTINKVMMSPEAVSDRFIQAVKEKDSGALRKFINEGQLEMNATKADSKAFLEFLNERPQMITTIAEQLAKDTQKYNTNGNYAGAASDGEIKLLASLKKDGKKWLVFDHYVVQIRPVYLKVTSTEDKTTVFVEGKKVGTMDSEKETMFGPFLPGIFEVKAVVEGEYGKVENEQEADFSEMEETKAMLSFDFTDNYVELYTDNDDATLYVNGKSTKKKIGEIGALGPIPLDGSVKVYAQKEFSSGMKKSDTIKIDEDTYDADLNLGYDDYDEQYELAQAESEEQEELEEETEEVIDTIMDHYGRISNDDFQSAYSLFSSNMQSKFGVDGWTKGLEANVMDDVTSVEIESMEDNSAQAYIEMTSYDDQEDGSVLVQEWEGYWDLIKEDGQWKLDDTELEKVDSWTES